jgi:sensor histidine kinase regulating citrate/malate metabolism
MVASNMKKVSAKKRVVLMALSFMNGLILLLLMFLSSKLSGVILLNIFLLNLLLSLALYQLFLKEVSRVSEKYPQSEQTVHLTQSQKERLKEIQAKIDKNEYEDALSLIGDYATEDYKDLLEGLKLPYVLAVMLGRYRKICSEEDIEFSIQILDGEKFNKVKMNFLVNIIGNLLDNALDEVRTLKIDRNITIKMETTAEDQVIIWVLNPIKHKHMNLDNLFKEGFSTKKKVNGMTHERGYGLSLVHKLVEEQQGQIRVYIQDQICFEVVI